MEVTRDALEAVGSPAYVGLGFGVGVWGLGFGVWGLGFGFARD